MLNRVGEAIEAIRNGRMVIMVDDEDRENEGDLVLAAECVTPEQINFLAKYARGLICLTLEPELVDALKLPMMEDSTKRLPTQGTAFTVSIEARDGVTTGISAADRAHTIQVAIANGAKPEDIVVPGHIFPLKARPGGVLERAGHTEGSVDIAKMAGYKGAGVICEIMNDDGTMARMSDLETFAKEHNIPIIAIADLIQYRLLKETMVEEVERQEILTDAGPFTGVLFRNLVDRSEHLAILKGDGFENHVVDVRVHGQKNLCDAIGSRDAGSGKRLAYGLDMLKQVDRGILIYLTRSEQSLVPEFEELISDFQKKPKESKANKKAPGVDVRLHGTGAQILRSLGVSKMRIHTTSPMALKGLSGFGLEIVETNVFSYK
ncbi:GTP cyclohydrolase II /3,4-dihydroxy-2-butanone 4-phosphate synthase [Pseudobacteriovorax antillogorgiicola]|uniref:3,4-dihydroxy-2-butanone 4-phosphate synthase n=2 Tax=Pseudobacteriovorax antillogorgiicola TaxID=1513793 RepID=A0A1Y6CR68_9BACT|nr:GTP cyclohydrolase II /3,4-dihydroxy-2-butanone 4-phosphate synthase [Pseudobacteriovorax antillogorgiicola]SMF69765.1 GTP cyclohydrolase II /3,4-dihydroxy-2-butanone 4-phosphate synthase [Pseudobacteriovorax antillogorgiicola]